EATTMGEGRGARPQADELPEGVRPAHGPDGAFEVETLELVAGNSPPLGLAPRTEHLGRHEDAPAAKSRISSPRAQVCFYGRRGRWGPTCSLSGALGEHRGRRLENSAMCAPLVASQPPDRDPIALEEWSVASGFCLRHRGIIL